MPWAVCTSTLPVFREDEPPMSRCPQEWRISRKSVGRQAYLRASLASREVLLDLGSEPVRPRKADGGSQSLLVYRTSRQVSLIQRQRAFFPSRERIY